MHQKSSSSHRKIKRWSDWYNCTKLEPYKRLFLNVSVVKIFHFKQWYLKERMSLHNLIYEDSSVLCFEHYEVARKAVSLESKHTILDRFLKISPFHAKFSFLSHSSLASRRLAVPFHHFTPWRLVLIFPSSRNANWLHLTFIPTPSHVHVYNCQYLFPCLISEDFLTSTTNLKPCRSPIKTAPFFGLDVTTQNPQFVLVKFGTEKFHKQLWRHFSFFWKCMKIMTMQIPTCTSSACTSTPTCSKAVTAKNVLNKNSGK